MRTGLYVGNRKKSGRPKSHKKGDGEFVKLTPLEREREAEQDCPSILTVFWGGKNGEDLIHARCGALLQYMGGCLYVCYKCFPEHVEIPPQMEARILDEAKWLESSLK